MKAGKKTCGAQFVGACLLVLTMLCSCERWQSLFRFPKAPAPPAAAGPLTAASPTASPVAAFSPLPLGEKIGQLDRFTPKVSFHRKAELVWQDVFLRLPFYRFDVVRTEKKADARISLLNGSSLELSENTVVILNPGEPAPRTGTDRAVIRDGQVTGQTEKELWLLTSAALFKIRQAGRKHKAIVSLSVKEGMKLRVRLEEGEGVVLSSPIVDKPETKAVTWLKKGKAITLAAPVAAETFGSGNEVLKWAEEPFPSRAPRSPRRTASLPPPVKPIEILITSPANYSEVSRSYVEVTGKTTGPGAKVLINGTVVTLDDRLQFSTQVPLSSGANSILVQLIRPGGEVVTRRWTVVRNE